MMILLKIPGSHFLQKILWSKSQVKQLSLDNNWKG